MPKTLLRPKTFAKEYPEQGSEASIRWKIHNADSNGYARAILRDGRQVFIDVEEWFSVLEEKNPHRRSAFPRAASGHA